MLYFVSKLKLISNKPSKKEIQKNKVSLLCYAMNDTDGWELVKREAKLYMTSKNEELCDQTKNREEENVKQMYVIREAKHSDDKINTIEVYKQWQEKIKGYLGSSYKDHEVKVAEFSLTKFNGNIECRYCNIDVYIEKKTDSKPISTKIGSVNPQLLKELKDSEMFRTRINQVAKYSRYDDSDDIIESE